MPKKIHLIKLTFVSYFKNSGQLHELELLFLLALISYIIYISQKQHHT